ADWLEEHDRPQRAEFIRVQVELALSPDCGHTTRQPPCDTCTHRRREEELLAEHGDAWLAHLPGEGWTCRRTMDWVVAVTERSRTPRQACFRRGFVEAVFLPADDFAEHGHALVARQPLTRVQLLDQWPCALPRNRFGWTSTLGPYFPA